MRTTILLAILVLLSCSDVWLFNPIDDGTYAGTFTITLENGLTKTGNVTFTFKGRTYSCVPDKQYLPPGGAGEFLTFGRTIRIKDTALHTAEFDWTLILNGDFEFTFDGSRLVLQQNDTKHHRFRVIDLIRR